MAEQRITGCSAIFSASAILPHASESSILSASSAPLRLCVILFRIFSSSFSFPLLDSYADLINYTI